MTEEQAERLEQKLDRLQAQFDRIEQNSTRLLTIIPILTTLGDLLVRRHVAVDRTGMGKNTPDEYPSFREAGGERRTYLAINDISVIPRRGKRPTPDMGCLYLIRAEETGRYKVGYSGSGYLRRVRYLQTNSPYILDVVAAREGTLADEKDIHGWLGGYRLHGEWFECSDEVELLETFLDGRPNLHAEVFDAS